MNKPITEFIETYYLHFNAATVVDAAKSYEEQLDKGSKMLVSLGRSNEYSRNRKDFC